MYAVIMASGTGTRLWPLSRKDNPKQFHPLVTEKTLLRETFERANLKFETSKIFVVLTAGYFDRTREMLPELDEKNFIVEPHAGGTISACGLAAKIINNLDPDSAIVCLPADHLIRDEQTFVKTLDYAVEIIRKNPKSLLQIGIRPDNPDTGMGYIQLGEQLESDRDKTLFAVNRFVEKPDLETAKSYLESGDYLWNAGIYSFRTDFMLDMYEKFVPETARAIEKIAASVGTDEYTDISRHEYSNIENTSIDYAIAEKIKDILVIPADFGWSDIGSWGVLLETLSKMSDEKIISRGHHIDVGSEDCLVIADKKLIATVGLKDIIIIDTPDVVLVCDKHHSQKIKEVIEKLKEQNKHQYL